MRHNEALINEGFETLDQDDRKERRRREWRRQKSKERDKERTSNRDRE